MKTGISLRPSLLVILSSLFITSAFISCSKEKDATNNDTTYTTSGSASGSQVTPPVATAGTATLTGTYNSESNKWDYVLNWSGLSSPALEVELHGPAAIGANGNLLINLVITTPGSTGSATGMVTLTPQQEEFLLSDETYYIVLTATHPTGEIRGQVVTNP